MQEERGEKISKLSNLTSMICLSGSPKVCACVCVSHQTGEKTGTCYSRAEGGAHEKKHFARFCDWAERRRGLKVDSSVMHGGGTGLSANSLAVMLTAGSAFYSLHLTQLWISAAGTRKRQQNDGPAACLHPLMYVLCMYARTSKCSTAILKRSALVKINGVFWFVCFFKKRPFLISFNFLFLLIFHPLMWHGPFRPV